MANPKRGSISRDLVSVATAPERRLAVVKRAGRAALVVLMTLGGLVIGYVASTALTRSEVEPVPAIDLDQVPVLDGPPIEEDSTDRATVVPPPTLPPPAMPPPPPHGGGDDSPDDDADGSPDDAEVDDD